MQSVDHVRSCLVRTEGVNVCFRRSVAVLICIGPLVVEAEIYGNYCLVLFSRIDLIKHI